MSEDHILDAGQARKFGVDKDASCTVRPERTSGVSGGSPIPGKALSATVTFSITDDRVATHVARPAMRAIGNLLWFRVGGPVMGVAWWCIGALAFLTILGIPFDPPHAIQEANFTACANRRRGRPVGRR